MRTSVVLMFIAIWFTVTSSSTDNFKQRRRKNNYHLKTNTDPETFPDGSRTGYKKGGNNIIDDANVQSLVEKTEERQKPLNKLPFLAKNSIRRDETFSYGSTGELDDHRNVTEGANRPDASSASTGDDVATSAVSSATTEPFFHVVLSIVVKSNSTSSAVRGQDINIKSQQGRSAGRPSALITPKVDALGTLPTSFDNDALTGSRPEMTTSAGMEIRKVWYDKYTTSHPHHAESNDSRALWQDDEKSSAVRTNPAIQLHDIKLASANRELQRPIHTALVDDDDVVDDGDDDAERRLLVKSLESVASQLAELRGFIRRLWAENSALYREMMTSLSVEYGVTGGARTGMWCSDDEQHETDQRKAISTRRSRDDNRKSLVASTERQRSAAGLPVDSMVRATTKATKPSVELTTTKVLRTGWLDTSTHTAHCDFWIGLTRQQQLRFNHDQSNPPKSIQSSSSGFNRDRHNGNGRHTHNNSSWYWMPSESQGYGKSRHHKKRGHNRPTDHLPYTNWNSGEPNNAGGDSDDVTNGGGEQCVEALWVFGWKWNDADCEGPSTACYACQTGASSLNL